MNSAGGLAKDAIAVVLAGGRGARLGPLTRSVCKPALPFGAAYRNIDFSLSNCVNSGIRRIGVATQHRPEPLLGHLDAVWNGMARRNGEFITAWPAEARAPRGGYRGTADAVFRNWDRIEEQSARIVLVLAGDHIYQMDYRPMLEFHRSHRADVTVACIEVAACDASRFGILSVDPCGRIRRFVEKPDRLDECFGRDRVLASMGIYAFDTEFAERVLRRDAASDQSTHDFGSDILPSLLREARVCAYPFVSAHSGAGFAYWRDVGTPAAYWRAHMDLLGNTPRLRLNDPRWPLPAAGNVPALTARHVQLGADPTCEKSLIADGCEIGGKVHRSVLFAGVRVPQGSLVERSVVLPGAVIGNNCRISGAIVDSNCRIADGMIIDALRHGGEGGHAKEPVIVTDENLAPERVYAYG